MTPPRRLVPVVLLALAALLPAPALAQEPPPPDTSTWPGVFHPFHMFDVQLEMADADFATIRNDLTNEIEVPAMFSVPGETPIKVSVRRKSSRTVAAAPNKFSMKVDINEFEDEPGGAERWHGLTKLSLENGVDTDPVAEGLAWNLHELASGPEFYGASHHGGLASWVRVFVNGEYVGVYVNAEQRDKQMLRNRALPRADGAAWLYEIDDITGWALESGVLPHSPTFTELCYAPFSTDKRPRCATPSSAQLVARLPQIIDMQSMLTQGAIDAFSSNADALFSHGKNIFYADFADPALRRRYFVWDLDGAMGDTGGSIYGRGSGRKLSQTAYQSVLLRRETFRSQYNAIMCALTRPGQPATESTPAVAPGPLTPATVNAFLDQLEPVLTPALAADPAIAASPAGLFDSLRQFVATQVMSVRSQVASDQPPGCGP